MAPDAVLARLAAREPRHLEALARLVAIPGVSAEPAPSAALEASAAAVAGLLVENGLQHVEILRPPGHHPFVLADRLVRPGAPTVLLYAHHDVVAPGDPARWITPPWTLSVRDGRAFGRGAVDDKGGLVAQVAAVEAFLAGGGLPVNVRVLVDGEEEVSSPALPGLLAERAGDLRADAVVVLDTANLAPGVPCLTTSLRGIASCVVETRALAGPVHSGMWGGAVPDAALALCQILGRCADQEGTCLVGPAPEVSGQALDRLATLPFDADTFRRDAGLLPDVEPLDAEGARLYARLWLRPAVAVTALEAHPLAGASNQVLPAARARVSLRVAPGQDAAAVLSDLVALLMRDPPQGVRVRVEPEVPARPWSVDPSGPVFEAAFAALADGFGRAALRIGCGATIPVVAPFADAMPGVPILLLGIEDPYSRPHAEDESLGLEDWRAVQRTLVHLLDRLAV